MAKGRTQGEAKGREEARLATAKALKSKGINPNVIAECTGLSQERISSL